jgi:hypothetical protein
MVYILAANKDFKYQNGRSRIIYIGATKRGAGRPAASAVNKASQAFGKLHGAKDNRSAHRNVSAAQEFANVEAS